MPPVHDYVIDNSTGANVRADINNVLQAILTNNSSSSAPSTTAAYMWWADTTNGVLKIRNSSNNDWVELFQLDGTLTLEDGSASTPALAFRDDLNTGIFSSAADTFNVATAGVERMELGATTIFNEDGADVDFRIEGDSKVNLFYLNAGTDRIGINEDAPSALFHVAGTDGQTVGSISSSLPLLVSKNGNCGVAIIGASDAKSIITLGDPDDADVGMIEYDHSSNNMMFTTSAGERMRIDSSGNVGIGTTSNHDDSVLEVRKAAGGDGVAIRVTNHSTTDGSQSGIIFTTTTSDFTSAAIAHKRNDNALIFYNGQSTSGGGFANATERMRIDSTGDVRFSGTNLTDNTNKNVNLTTPSFDTDEEDVNLIQVENESSQNSITFGGGTSGLNSATLIRFLTSSAVNTVTGTERMRIDSSGNVGIGDSNPDGKLHIGTGTNTDGTDIDVIIGGTSVNTRQARIRKKIQSSDRALQFHAATGSSKEDIRFFSDDTTETVRIDTSGRVGIGTDNPSQLLEINGASNPAVLVKDTTNDCISYMFSQDSVATFGSASNHDVVFNTNNGEKMRIDTTGNFLVGTTSVDGDGLSIKPRVADNTTRVVFNRANTSDLGVAVEFLNNNAGSGNIKYNNSSTQYNTSSDYRLKENVTAISDGITRLKTLKPYRFNFKVNPSTTVDGFFAHEVTAVPEAISGEKDAVNEDGSIDPQGIDQSKLVPLLVAALQELITRVETLEAA